MRLLGCCRKVMDPARLAEKFNGGLEPRVKVVLQACGIREFRTGCGVAARFMRKTQVERGDEAGSQFLFN